MVVFEIGRCDRFLDRAFLGGARVQDDLVFYGWYLSFFFFSQDRSLSVAFNIKIACIRPRLMRFMKEDVAKVRPSVSKFNFARLAAINFYGRQADRHGRLASINATGRFHANDGVSPLVKATRLRLATFYLVRVGGVMTLGRLVDRLNG